MKIARLTIIDELNTTTYNHHPGINQPFDISLCGQDLLGDRIGSERWSVAKEQEGKITCPDCLRIIVECQTLKKGIDF